MIKPIGYYNPHSHPVSFSGTRGQMVEVTANTPCTDRATGKLIPNSPLLDQQVADGILKRIFENHPDFKDWDRKAERRRSAVRVTADEANRMTIEQVTDLRPEAGKAGKSKKSPVSTVSSKSGVIEGTGLVPKPVTVDGDRLPPGADPQPDGSILFENKKFASLTALKVYVTSKAASLV